MSQFRPLSALAPVKNGIVAVLSACAVVAVVAVQSIAFTPDARAQTSNPCSAGQGVFPDGQCHTCPPAYENSATLTADGFCTCPEGKDFIAVLGDVGSNICVSQNIADAFNQCRASGYLPSYFDEDVPGRNYCEVPTRNVGQSRNLLACLLDNSADTVSPHCTAVFGPDLVIPQKPTDGSAPRYVFNCDPDGDNGLIPATINTIGATECACPAGKAIRNGVCVAASAEVCGELTPAQFYDAAAGACVPVVECVSPEVWYPEANDCHAPSSNPLRAAVLAGDLDLVNHFITVHMADVNRASASGVTPLHYAANGGHAAIAFVLIAAGADVNAKDDEDETPLRWAAGADYVTVVVLLLEAGADVDGRNDDDETPLHWAARNGRDAVVAALIAGGADVDAQDKDDDTPLHFAARFDRAAVVSLLIQATASLNVKNKDDKAPLHWAAEVGYPAVVSALIAGGADVNAKDKDDKGPLHWAAEGGHAAVVAALLAGGADVNAKDEDNETPLHLAVAGGHAAAAAALIAGGAYWGEAACGSGETTNPAGSAPPCLCEPPTVGTTGNCVAPSKEICGGLDPAQFYDAEAGACVSFVDCVSPEVLYAEVNDCHAASDYPLHDAVKAGDLDLVNHFVTVHMSDVNAKSNTYGDTPLHVAAQYDRASIAVALIAAGADVDAENSAGRTPLDLAYIYGNAAVARALLAEGEFCESGEIPNPGDPLPACVCEPPTVGTSGNCAAPSAESCGGLDPGQFYDAAADACVPFVECAAPEVLYAETNDCHAASDDPLGDAAKAGDLDLVNHFVTVHMSDVNATNVSLEAPLHLAARAGHAAIAAALILATANVNARSGAGGAPLHMAAAGGHVAVVSLLIAATASVDAKDNNGETPLHMAVVGGHSAAVSLLIAAGASVDAKNDDGETPLHLAAGNGRAAAVAALLAGGAAVNAQDDDDETPLHFAARNGRAVIVSLLIQATASLNVKNEDDKAPLHWAAEGGYPAVVSALIAGGADVNAKDEDNETPLHLAVAGGHAAVAAALIAGGAYWGEAACGSGEATNPAGSAPPCVCESNAGTSGNCVAASAEVCGGLTPAQFYDAAAGACVPFVDCVSPEVLHAEANDCHAASDYPLHDAVKAGDLDLVNHFVTVHMSDVNAKSNTYGDTPLHVAAQYDRASIAVALIAAGADVDAENSAGRTPLDLAYIYGNAAVARALLAEGEFCESGEIPNPGDPLPACVCEPPTVGTSGNCAAPSAESCGGLDPGQFYDAAADACVPFVECAAPEVLYAETNDCHAASDDPLGDAAKAGDLDLVNHFVTVHMSDVNATNVSLEAPLHLAARAGHAAIAAALISATANVNARSGAGGAPLHMAAAGGHVAVVSLLIAAGADLDARAANGDTALHLAADGGRAAMVFLLIAATASLNVKNDDDKAPLHLAADAGHAAIVTELIAAGAYWGDAACGSEEIVNPADAAPPCLNLLRQAVIRGDFSAVKALLAAGVDVDARDANNNTELHWAADTGHDVMVSLLIQATASLNVQNNDGDTPLHLSAKAGHVTVVSLLIQATASLNVQNNDGDTPLHLSAEAGHVTVVSLLIQAAASLNVKNNAYGDTPLHLAALTGHAAIVDALIAAGAGVNEQNNDDRTPLHFGVSSNNAAIVDALIAAKASVNVKDVSESTPLLWAATSRRSAAIIDALIAAGAYWGDAPCESGLAVNPANSSPPCIDLHQAAAGGHVFAVAALIATGATVDAQDGDGDTPLHLAAEAGRLAVVSLLIQATASLNVKNDDDKAPLRLAADGGHAAIVALLIEAGAYWGDAACAIGLTANPAGSVPRCIDLHQAVRGGHVFAVAALIATGATVDAQDGDGDTPLHLAAEAGHAVIVSLLIQATASLNVKNNTYGDTPLHSAAFNGRAAIVDALIAAGAGVNEQNNEDQTPLHFGIYSHNAGIVDALIAARASVNVKNSDGQTPLWWAVNLRSSAAIIAALIEAGAYWGDAPCESGLATNPANSSPPHCIDLHQAVRGGHVFAVATLIATGATLDAQDDDGDTPLHLAAADGHAVIVSLLIQATASLNVKNDDDKAPLHLAADGGHAAIVALLVEAGAYWGDAACESGEFSNPAGAAPPCLCEPPTVRTLQGNCAAPSKESCGGLDPAQFYDAAADACVLFVECAPPEVLYAEGNDCHAESDYPLHDAVLRATWIWSITSSPSI